MPLRARKTRLNVWVAGTSAALIWLAWPVNARSASLGSIVSVNLCADQLLMALAAPSRIVALGPFARDPNLSFMAKRAIQFPRLSGRSEELLVLQADAFLVGPFDNKAMRSVLERRGAKVLNVDRWLRVADVRRGVEEFASAIGEAAAGAALMDEMDRALRKLSELPRTHETTRSFLVLHRRGYVDDGGLLTELLGLAGLKDASRTGSTPPRFADVETIVSLRPDFLVLADPAPKAEDRGIELLLHPALSRLYPKNRRIYAPDNLTICGGPSTPALIGRLIEQLGRLLQRR